MVENCWKLWGGLSGMFCCFPFVFPLSTLSLVSSNPAPSPPTPHPGRIFYRYQLPFFPVVMKLFRSLTISAGCVKTQTAGFNAQSFWFSNFEVWPVKCHFWQVLAAGPEITVWESLWGLGGELRFNIVSQGGTLGEDHSGWDLQPAHLLMTVTFRYLSDRME